MRFSSCLAGLGLMASVTMASPITNMGRHKHGSGAGQNVLYWGQNGGNVVEHQDLATYCSPEAGIDIIILAFLSEFGNGVTFPSGTIGQSCSISTTGKSDGCSSLASDIQKCQSAGVKVILSLGGASGAYSLQSKHEAKTIGQNLWDMYGKDGNSKGPRPFGDAFVNGWDFDIESNSGNQYYEYLISQLRSNFKSDPENPYYITGAPQCPIPEPNMNEIITKAQFDYLWVQFYNNPSCSVGGTINFDEWESNIAHTPSADAKIFIGVPASPMGATGTASGAHYYLKPSKLARLVSHYKSKSVFGGVMMWAAGFSDSNKSNGCNYAQQSKHILTTGFIC